MGPLPSTRARVVRAFDDLRATLWFVPSLLTAAGLLGAVLLVTFHTAVDPVADRALPWVFVGEPDSARRLMSAVATSVATIAGTTFSVTMVALTLAAGQFSPRVLRGLVRDRINQVVLGGLIATFTYALVVLRGIRNGDDGVPNLAVTAGFLLALASMGLLILFIHHMADSVQVAAIVERITRETVAEIPRLFPSQLGAPATGDELVPPSARGPRVEVRADAYGYLQFVDQERLLCAASKAGVLVELHKRPGDFVTYRDTIATIWPAAAVGRELAHTVRGSLLLGRYPSIDQDARYGVRLIADIGVKALSPSLNDPTTAMLCIDMLGTILAHVAGRALPSPHRKDARGDVRVIAHGASFEELVQLAFHQIGAYGARDARVLGHVVDTLAALWPIERDPDRRRALENVLGRVDGWAATGLRGVDATVVRERVRALRDTWAGDESPGEHAPIPGLEGEPRATIQTTSPACP